MLSKWRNQNFIYFFYTSVIKIIGYLIFYFTLGFLIVMTIVTLDTSTTVIVNQSENLFVKPWRRGPSSFYMNGKLYGQNENTLTVILLGLPISLYVFLKEKTHPIRSSKLRIRSISRHVFYRKERGLVNLDKKCINDSSVFKLNSIMMTEVV